MRQARYASVFAVVAGAFVPLNFIAVRLAQQYVHPRVLTLAGGNLPGSMRLTFLISLVGITLLYVTLWKYEMAAKNARMQVRRLRRTLLGDDAVARRTEGARPRHERTADPRRGSGAAAAHGGQVRRRRLHRVRRADPDLRRDHGARG